MARTVVSMLTPSSTKTVKRVAEIRRLSTSSNSPSRDQRKTARLSEIRRNSTSSSTPSSPSRGPRKIARAAPKRTEEEMVKREKEGRREMEEMEAMSKRKKCRGKYLDAVVLTILKLKERKGSSRQAIIIRMKEDFPHFSWGNKPLIKRHMALALKAGVDQDILGQQDWATGKGSGFYKLSQYEIKRQRTKTKDAKVSAGLQNIERVAEVVDLKEVETGSLEMEERSNKSKAKNNIFTLVKLQKVTEEQLLLDPKTQV